MRRCRNGSRRLGVGMYRLERAADAHGCPGTNGFENDIKLDDLIILFYNKAMYRVSNSG